MTEIDDGSERDGEPSVNPARTQVFMIWDSQIQGIQFDLHGLIGTQVDGLDVTILGLEPNDGDVLTDHVLKKIDTAERVAAIVDLPNVNVGFEIGYALAKKKEVRLLRWGGAEQPAWTKKPPLIGQLITPTGSSGPLRDRLSLPGNGASIPAHPVSGADTLFLCPTKGTGESVVRQITTLKPKWRRLDNNGCKLETLGNKLRDVGRVIWVITPYPEKTDERDGMENACASVVAGFAFGVGIDVRVWAQQEFKRWDRLDIAGIASDFNTPNDLDALIEELAEAPPTSAAAPLEPYRRMLRRRHRRLTAFFADASDDLDDVYVELALTPTFERGEHDVILEAASKGRQTLRQLLDGATVENRRFAVLGDPGAGKSTICRRLCYLLADELKDDPNRPVPIFVSLVSLASAETDLFGMAERDVRVEFPDQAEGLAKMLRELAEKSDRVWILLDGLDEVPEEQVATARDRIDALVQGYPRCRFVVTARKIGYQTLPGFQKATVQPLDEASQRALLCKWLGDEKGGRLLQHVAASPALLDSAHNPLLLALLAMLSKEQEGLPATRVQLYDGAIDLLLRRGHGEKASDGVKEPIVARNLLRRLSLTLQESEGEAWSKEHLVNVMVDDIAGKDDAAARRLQSRGGAETFLNEVASQSGLLADHRDRGGEWRFLHRSLREFLAAKRLMELGEKDYGERVAKLSHEAEEEDSRDVQRRLAHWGETFALLCGLPETSDERRKLLERIRDASHPLALRALPHVDGLTATQVLKFLDETKGWDGDLLSGLVGQWLLRGTSRESVHALLMDRVSVGASTKELAYLYYAMEQNDLPVDREAFFRKCDRWPKTGFPDIKTVDLPPEGESSEFWMGSPDKVGHDNERPRHRVKLSPFRLGVTTVTEAVYALFDDRAHHSKKRVDDPVVDVNWWESWLFARWIGGSLPTEAQWEYACRARSDAQWCFGDDKTKLKDYAWFGEGVSGSPHPVQKKEKNDFGLFDMHGNVWEWCADWRAPYPAELADSSAKAVEDPIGPAAGSARVLRGGCYWDDADRTRSACRVGNRPGSRHLFSGFRVAFPARAAGPPDLGDR